MKKNLILISTWNQTGIHPFGMGLLLVSALATLASSQTILIDDFDDGDFDGWTTIDSTVGQSYGPGKFDASSGAFHLETSGVVPAGIPGGGFIAAEWDQSSDPVYTDGFLRAKLRADTYGSIASLALRNSGSLETGFDGYLFIGKTYPTPEFLFNRIERNEIAEVRTLDAQDLNLTFQEGEVWNFEVGAVGEQLSMKVWHNDDPEPESPQMVFTDSNYRTGKFAIETNNWVGSVRNLEKPTQVSATFDNIYFTFAREPGDFDDDGDLDIADLNGLVAQINGDMNISFDVTGDRNVDDQDLNTWVKELKRTWIGDANLDGEFNSGDLTVVFQAAKYEAGVNAGWDQGDWTGDERFDSGDLIAAFQDGGYEQGARAAVATVPEPHAATAIFLGGIICLSAARRRTG